MPHLSSGLKNKPGNHHEAARHFILVYNLCSSSTLKIAVSYSSETPADFQRIIRRYTSEDRTLHSHSCGNLESYIPSENTQCTPRLDLQRFRYVNALNSELMGTFVYNCGTRNQGQKWQRQQCRSVRLTLLWKNGFREVSERPVHTQLTAVNKIVVKATLLHFSSTSCRQQLSFSVVIQNHNTITVDEQQSYSTRVLPSQSLHQYLKSFITVLVHIVHNSAKYLLLITCCRRKLNYYERWLVT